MLGAIRDFVTSMVFEQPQEPPTDLTLYEQMRYCVFCGAELDKYVVESKECPLGCGRVHPDEDMKGLPVIVFEPIENYESNADSN